MNAINTYFIDVLKNHYFDFKGRATRKQFWMYVLFMFIIGIVLGILAKALGDTIGSVLSLVVGLAFLLPNLGIAVRRLHDTDRSGWWILLGFIPVINFIGGIVLLVFYVLPSTGANRFGN